MTAFDASVGPTASSEKLPFGAEVSHTEVKKQRLIADPCTVRMYRAGVDPKETMSELFGVGVEVLPISKELGAWVVHPLVIANDGSESF